MLGAARSVARRTRCSTVRAPFSSTAKKASQSHKTPHLDPSLEDLLRDAPISLKGAKPPPEHKELEVVASSQSILRTVSKQPWSDESVEFYSSAEQNDALMGRKSPAAAFGSHQLGEVVLPHELQNAITSLIADTNKPRLHSDVKRLYQSNPGEDTPQWDLQHDVKYHSRKQAAKHAIRDGTAFASVALPAHYSAIVAVLNHLKERLGPDLDVKRVMDWGAGAGTGLWASAYTFQQASALTDPFDQAIAHTALEQYMAFDRREGLVSIGKRLLAKVSATPPEVIWQNGFREEDKVSDKDGKTTLALCAFTLSSLPNPLAQKQMVQEIWNSGAHTIVLIDHKNADGFESIARAREYMLDAGRRELDRSMTSTDRGCHIVAPCPHDRTCPLLGATGSLVCGFSQRLQRPSFVRLTKHSKVGHEDTEYCYVVIRRGPRPEPVASTAGRLGGVGLREIEKQRIKETPMRELSISSEAEPLDSREDNTSAIGEEVNPEELDAQLRREAFQWPRLVFPPLKKSGHILLDACTSEGKIMRLTIPKSQGKQPFYDARKSNWGDLFPHAPKNRPIERYQPSSYQEERPVKSGGDIGKRRDTHKDKLQMSYATVAERLREKKLSKREYARTRVDKAWQFEN